MAKKSRKTGLRGRKPRLESLMQTGLSREGERFSLATLAEVATVLERRSADAVIAVDNPGMTEKGRQRLAASGRQQWRRKRWRQAAAAREWKSLRARARIRDREKTLPLEAEMLAVFPDGVVTSAVMAKALDARRRTATDILTRLQVLGLVRRVTKTGRTHRKLLHGVEYHPQMDEWFWSLTVDGRAARSWSRWQMARVRSGIRHAAMGRNGSLIPRWIRGELVRPHRKVKNDPTGGKIGYFSGDPEDSPWPDLGRWDLAPMGPE